jgi:hypothetical protein
MSRINTFSRVLNQKVKARFCMDFQLMDNLHMTALARNQNNVSDWSDMSTRGLLFQWASTIKNPTLCNRTSPSSHWKLTWTHHNIVKQFLNWRKTTTNQYILKVNLAQQICCNHEQRYGFHPILSHRCSVEFLIRFIWENEGSVLQFVTINVKIYAS